MLCYGHRFRLNKFDFITQIFLRTIDLTDRNPAKISFKKNQKMSRNTSVVDSYRLCSLPDPVLGSHVTYPFGSESGSGAEKDPNKF